MNTPDAPGAGGRRLRRRVRMLTAGAVGAAVIASAGVTAILADGQDTQESVARPSTPDSPAAGPAAGPTAGASTPSDTGVTSGSSGGTIRPPGRAAGDGHVTTGGS